MGRLEALEDDVVHAAFPAGLKWDSGIAGWGKNKG